MTIEQSLSGTETTVSSWLSIIQRFWPDHRSSDTEYNHSSTQEPSNNTEESEAISKTLASLLHEKISCFELIPSKKQGYSRIPNCRQLESWDCGIACLLMILRWLSPKQTEYSSQMIPEEKRKRQELLQYIGSESIWTADIVLQLQSLLQHENADYIFCSKNLTVDDEYRDVGYYRASFGTDKHRVEKAFSQLEKRSTNLFSASCLPLPIVMNAVCNPNCVAIVLLDNHTLYAKETDNNRKDEYVGHYVVLCGISREREHIAAAEQQDGSSGKEEKEYCLVLLNPGIHSPPIMHVTPSRFERSWRATGTDDDIVFIIRQ